MYQSINIKKKMYVVTDAIGLVVRASVRHYDEDSD